ncbi:MAG: sigma-70 family RNA polymerase sigma factor, partial [Planctomycetota bacterium]
MVYRQCYRLLGNHEDAVDATQQVFVKLFTRGQTVHTAVEPWLRQTANHTAVSYLRSEIARRRYEGAFEPMAGACDEPGRMEHDELRRAVRRCLASLEPRDREAVERHLMVGEPQASIAEDWGVTQLVVLHPSGLVAGPRHRL